MVTARTKIKGSLKTITKTSRPSAGTSAHGDSAKSGSAQGTNPKDLLNQIKEHGTPAVLLVVGPDQVRIQRLIDAVLKSTPPSIASGRSQNVHPRRYQGSSISEHEINEIHVQAATISMFTPQQVFLIEGVDLTKSAINTALVELIEAFSSPNLLLLTATALPTNSVIRSRSLAKGKNLGVVVELPELTPSELQAWTKRELLNAGVVNPSTQIIDEVIVLAESKPDRIAAISEHLGLYSNGQPPTPADLAQLFHTHNQITDFALLDAIQSGNRLKTTTTIQQLLSAGKSPFLLLAMLGRTFGQYLTLAAARAVNLAPAQIKSLVPMQPWLFDKYLQASSRYSLQRLRLANAAIVRADSLLKNRSLGADAILESLCCELTPEGQNRPRERLR